MVLIWYYFLASHLQPSPHLVFHLHVCSCRHQHLNNLLVTVATDHVKRGEAMHILVGPSGVLAQKGSCFSFIPRIRSVIKRLFYSKKD